MAEGPIKHDDIIEEDVFQGTIEQGKLLLSVFNDLEKGIKSLAVESTKYFTISVKTLADLEKRKDALGQITALEKAHADIIKQKSLVEAAVQKIERENLKTSQEVEKLEQQRIKTDSAQISLQQKLVKEAEKANKVREAQIKNVKALNSVHEQEKKSLKSVSDRYKELVARGREGTVTGRLLKAEFDRLDKSVRKAEQGVGQFNRSVGNYKGAMKDALQETGLFNSGIGRLIVGLGNLKKRFEENSKAGGGFGGMLKLGAAGAAGLAIGGLTALASVNSGVEQGFEKLIAVIIGFVTGGFEGAKAALEMKEAMFESLKTLRDYRLAIQAIVLDEEDFIDISNDTTIGFKERNAALEEAIRLSKERARISLESAKLELDVINKQVAAGSIGAQKVGPELLDKQAEAQMKVNAAIDAQADILRETAQLERKLAEERTTAAIDLLLKSKQSANARKVILEKELADEGVQLERRKQAALELAQVNTKTTNEEIRIFKDGFKVKFDSNALVNEQDAVKLKQMIEGIQFLDENNKMVGIGVEAQRTLAQIVAKYQKEFLEFSDTKKKIDKEEIKRAERLQEIAIEMRVLQQQDDLKQLEDSGELLDNSIDKTLDKISEGENVFNSKLIKQLGIQRKLRDENNQKIFEARTTALTSQAALEKKNVENTITDEKIKAAEIQKIEQKLQIDLGNIAIESTNLDIENKESDLEEDKRIAKEKLRLAIEHGQKALDIAEQALQRQADKRQEFFDNEIDQRENNIDRQRELAERGLENTLVFEEEQKAKLELAREEEKRKEVRRQKAIAFLRLVAGYAEKDPNTAIPKAVADMAIASLIEGSFAEGVEGLQGKGTETSDSILARLSKNESVITAKATKENAGLPTAMNEGRVDDYFMNKYLPKVAIDGGIVTSTASNIHSSMMLNQLIGVNKRLEGLEKAIINKRETNTNIDNVGNVITTDIENGFKKVVIKMRKRPSI